MMWLVVEVKDRLGWANRAGDSLCRVPREAVQCT